MQIDEDLVQTKLDKFIFSPSWLDKFLDYALIAQTKIDSNHIPLLMQATQYSKMRSPFMFKAIWLTNPQLEERIEEWWSTKFKGTKMFQAHKKLNLVKSNLKYWSIHSFKQIDGEKEEIREDLDSIKA